MLTFRDIVAFARAHPVYFEFFKFGLVGCVGLTVDVGLLYTALFWGWGLYWGRAFSFLCAATTTWALNRRFTFRYDGPARRHHQWAKFVSVVMVGGAVNYSVYALLVSVSALIADYPFLGIAAGAVSGVLFNFILSREIVFGDRIGSG